MRHAFWLIALWAAAGHAQPPARDTSLPPQELVLRAIEATPEVHAAEAQLARAEAEQRMRRVGSHETQLTVLPQQRQVEGGARYREWEVALARGVRWPGKARLDREIGAQGYEAARLLLEDAHHAGARRLLALWTDWQRAGVLADVQQSQVALWQRDLAVVRRRVQLGDAARRDLVTVEAALAQARASALQALAAQMSARLALVSEFPGLPLPQQVFLPTVPPRLGDNDWVALVLQRSHEVGAAEAMVQQRRAEAARARAERMPDPVVGIRVLNERGGRERALGLTLSIPLGGSYRGAVAAAAGADALAAEARLSMVRREAKHDVQLAVAMARSLHGIWQQQKVARTAAEASASKAERAYALGESSLTDVLAARRVVQETALAERRASIDAVEAVARVEVDAHELWHRHEGADDDAAPSLPSLDY